MGGRDPASMKQGIDVWLEFIRLAYVLGEGRK